MQTAQSSGVGSVPRVNLMPPEIAESARMRQVQLVMGLGVLVAVVIVALLYMHEHSKVSAAKSQLTAAQDAEAGLNSKLASLASVRQTLADVQAKQALLTSAMGGEVRWSGVLSDLSLRIPHNVFLTSMTVAQTTTSTPSTPANTPGTPIGSITFAGTALRHDDVAAWLDSLAKERGFADPLFSSSTEAVGGTVTFSSTASVTTSAESGRYATPAVPGASPTTPSGG
jgi:Tfp pilus assembly protein PilN